MTPEEAIKILDDFEKQVKAKADGAYQTNVGKMACDMAIEAIKEIQQYREIGTVEEIKSVKKYIELKRRCGTPSNTIDLCAEYVAIGTVEECRKAVDKTKPKAPKDELKINPVIDENGAYVDADTTVYILCPNCGELVGMDEDIDRFCRECGQAILREGEDD